ncbi:MAG TPA: AMP-binding protein, partial [Kofleriaceae bacterium]
MTAVQLIFTDAVCKRADEVMARSPELRDITSSSEDLAFIRHASSSTEGFALACERYAHRDCFRSPTGRITYGALWDRVMALAAAWRRAGLAQPGTRVGIYGVPAIDWVVADLACLVAGAVSVPLSTSSTDAELHTLAAHAELTMIASDAKLVPTLQRALAELTPTIVSMDAFGSPAARIAPHVWSPDEPVTVMYTSGSTGRAKGVLLTERRWLSQLQTALSWPPFPHVQIGYLPLSSIAGRRFIYEAMMHGGITHFASDALPFGDVPLVRPTLIGMAPRVSTVLYQQFKSELLARLGTLPDNLFDDPVSVAVLDEMRTTAL